jgi:hypothetical protein
MRFKAPVLALAGLLAAAVPAQAVTITLRAFMDGSQETVPTPSMASGFAEVTLDTETHILSWVVTFQGPFIGTPVAMHFHGRNNSQPPNQGAPGSNAMVRIDLGVSENPNVGSFDLTTLPDYGAFIDQNIIDGLWYVNLHTTVFPAGEIRGQLEAIPEPTTVTLLGAGLVGLVLAARRRRIGA